MRQLFALAHVLLLGICVLSAQTPPPSQPAPKKPAEGPQRPTFRVDINFVEVDAVVTDAQGQFVRGLAQQDFEILEDGKPQRIETFSLVDVPVERADRPLFKSGPVEPDVHSNTRPFEGRLFLLLLDDIHTNALRSIRVKKAARQFIEKHLGANDLAAVAFTSGRSDGAQEFTGNKRLLLEAVDRFMGRKIRSATLEKIDEYYRTRDMRQPGDKINDPADFERGYYARMTFDSIAGLSEALTRVHGRRKALVLISEGVDYDISDVFGTTQATTVMDAARTAIASASRGNVSIYSVDPRGLTSMADEAMEIQSLPEDTTLGLGPTALYTELQRAQDSLRTLSDQTGGFAALNSNEFTTAFDRIIKDNSSYYLIGYYPQDERRDGRFRKIQVRVKQPGLAVRARKGYSAARGKAPSTTEAPGKGLSRDVRAALESALPVEGLSMAVAPAVFRGQGSKGSVLITTHVDGVGLKFTQKDGSYYTQIEVVAIATDMRGKSPDWKPATVELNLKPDTYKAVSRFGVRILSRLELSPGRYQLRVAGRDTGSGLTGSVHADLEVPDFTKPALSMSNLVMSSALAAIVPTARQDEELKGVLPGQPTVARLFSTNEEVAVFGEVYDNDTTSHKVDITTTLRADDGRTVFKNEEERASSELAGKTGGYGIVVSLPLMDLQDGVYVLRMEARSRLARDKTASREVQIGVVRPKPAATAVAAPKAEARTTGMTATSLFRGSQSAIVKPREVFIRTPEEWAALWQQHQPGGEVPQVDFSKHVVVGVFLGERPSGGYAVDVLRVSRTGEAFNVEYAEQAPAADQTAAQVMTAPFHLVAIGNVTAKTALFKRVDARK